MADPPSYPDTGITGQGSGPPPGRGQRAGWSRWKTAAIVVIVIALLPSPPGSSRSAAATHNQEETPC